ncbi:MAG: GNAT family N-acetyltransferase [Pseudomonadota bacterium]
MSRALLHQAGPEDLARLVPLIEAFHQEMGFTLPDGHAEHAVTPLLAGSPHGTAYLAGPRIAPLGYAVVCFGWSVEFGGLDGYLDELYVRPGIRGRGIAQQMLGELRTLMTDAGVGGLALEVDRTDAAAQRLYQRAGWKLRDRYSLMTLDLT